MRAWISPAEPGGVIALADSAWPEPARHEAVIAVEAYSVNRGETFLLERPRPGWRPGKDVAGTVVQQAADGSGPRTGTRVVGHPPHGGWAERVAVSTDALVALPDNVPIETAAALPLAGITALRLLRLASPLPGRRLLLTGASGGVGHYLTELAVASGADVTAVVAAPSRGDRLAAYGAHVITRIEEAAGDFDVALESVGATSLPAAVGCLKPGGLLVWFGQASRQSVTLDFFDLLRDTPSVTLRHFDYTDGGVYSQDLDTLVRLVAGGHLHPEIGRVADWTETLQVLTDLRARRIRGNAVLTVSANNSGAST